MTLFEKLKVNLDYLLGKSEPGKFENRYKNSKLSLKDWQKRWEVFSDDGSGFVWYGVDSENNLGQFTCETSYIPEAFFHNIDSNKKLENYFYNLPDITTSRLPGNLRSEVRKSAERDFHDSLLKMWIPLKEAQTGIFIFNEAGDTYWYKSEFYKSGKYRKNPYELLSIPDKYLKVSDLPTEIQELLQPYHFENLKFEDCQFLDVSQYLYCEN